MHTQLEYLEGSRRPEKTCCHSDISEKAPVKIGVKYSHWHKRIQDEA